MSTRFPPTSPERSLPTPVIRSNGAHRRGWDGPRLTLAIAMVFSGIFAATLASTIFSHLSIDNDETVYLLQAKAIASGHLFPQVGHPASLFTPWLGVIRGDHYVLKYTPVVAAYLAVSIALTGGYVAGLVVLSMSFVAATYLLAGEITGRRGTAAIAAALLAASPVVIVQSALVLPYLLFLVLAELAIWALLAGSRRRSSRLLACGGMCAGIAFVARSYDALLLLGPVFGWLLWTSRRGRIRLISAVAAGSVAPAIGLLWFDYAATGSALRLPFSLFQSGDTLGFGVHRVYPGERGRNFGIEQGWQGLARHLSLLGGGWMFGGVLLFLLASLALMHRLASAALLALAAGGALLVLGYLFFWGTWNAGIVWGGVQYLGPYYLMPALIPLCILGALGLQEIETVAGWKAVFISVLALCISAITFDRAASIDRKLNAANSQLASAIMRTGRSLIFVRTYPNYLQHPTAVISNAYPIGGRTVFAIARGADDFRVLSAYPERQTYRLRLLGEYGKQPSSGYGAQLQRLHLISGRELAMEVDVNLPGTAANARLKITVGNRSQTFTFNPHRTNRIRFALLAGRGQFPDLAADTGAAAHLTLMTSRTAEGPQRVADQLDIALMESGGLLHALAPSGPIIELGPLPAPPLSLTVASTG